MGTTADPRTTLRMRSQLPLLFNQVSPRVPHKQVKPAADKDLRQRETQGEQQELTPSRSRPR